MDAMIQMIENRLEKHNKETKFAPVKLVISLNVANHVLHISHALNRQRGHVILIGDAGRGRRSCATLAALMLDYDIFQVVYDTKMTMMVFKKTLGSIFRSKLVEIMAFTNGKKMWKN